MHRNWITKLSNKHIANPRQSKQHKIILASFQIKLQNNPKNNNNNNLPYCINNLRDNLEEFNDNELKLIKSCMNYDNDNWWADTSNKISQILKKNYPKNKKLTNKDDVKNKSHLDNLRDKRKNINYNIFRVRKNHLNHTNMQALIKTFYAWKNNHITPNITHQTDNEELLFNKYQTLTRFEEKKLKTFYNNAHLITNNIYIHLKNVHEKQLINKLKTLEVHAAAGNLKPIWKELKRKSKGNASYISELYTDENETKTPPNFIIANLTKHIHNTFYKNDPDKNHLNPCYMNSYLNSNQNVLNTDTNNPITQQIEKLNSNRQNAILTKYLNNNDIHNKYLNDSITINEIKCAIRHQKNNKAVGIDNIPAEIFKVNIEWWANELHACFNQLWNNTHPKGWQDGIIIFFFKKGDKRNINNYRPITLLPTIYKIWSTILSNRLTPILNLLTNEQQCAYKTKKSTMDIIYLIKNKYIKGEIKGQILLGLSKAFDRINRSKLWYIFFTNTAYLKTYLVQLLIHIRIPN